MASRQQEKERRRRERLEREAAARRAETRRRRLHLVLGGLAAIVLLGGVVAAAVAGLGGGSSSVGDARQATKVAGVTLPQQRIGELEPAAKAAGCKLVHARDEGAGHEARTFAPGDYNTNPPTSGTHDPTPAADGIYEPGDTPGLGNLVHALEHGRVELQYRTGTDAQTIKKLEALTAENDGYHLLLYENTTDMPFAVAATAWTQLLGCPRMNDRVFDALRTFRDRYVDQGPEQVP